MPVNDINNFKIQEWVEFSETSHADVIVEHVKATIQILLEVRALLESARGLHASWEGDAKKMHDDLYQFCLWYTNDIPPALEGYQNAAQILQEELNTLSTESTVLNHFKNVTSI